MTEEIPTYSPYQKTIDKSENHVRTKIFFSILSFSLLPFLSDRDRKYWFDYSMLCLGKNDDEKVWSFKNFFSFKLVSTVGIFFY